VAQRHALEPASALRPRGELEGGQEQLGDGALDRAHHEAPSPGRQDLVEAIEGGDQAGGGGRAAAADARPTALEMLWSRAAPQRLDLASS
jgi:hypothetical protein